MIYVDWELGGRKKLEGGDFFRPYDNDDDIEDDNDDGEDACDEDVILFVMLLLFSLSAVIDAHNQ